MLTRSPLYFCDHKDFQAKSDNFIITITVKVENSILNVGRGGEEIPSVSLKLLVKNTNAKTILVLKVSKTM